MFPELSSWSLVRRAQDGNEDAKSEFGRRYLPVARACLGARWRGSRMVSELEDAVQEVFVDCFREGGVIDRADRGAGTGFRAYLVGVVRTVALRFEERATTRSKRRAADSEFRLSQHPDTEADLLRTFEREWARALMREAAELQTERARSEGGETARQVEILRLRFEEGMPIRTIAEHWGEDAEALHRLYRRARRDFRAALRDVVMRHEGCDAGEAERQCDELAALLQPA